MMNQSLPAPVSGQLNRDSNGVLHTSLKEGAASALPLAAFPSLLRGRGRAQRPGVVLPGTPRRILHELSPLRKLTWAEGYRNSIDERRLAINRYATVNHSLP